MESTYISCPQIAFGHIVDRMFGERVLIIQRSMWDVHYPTPLGVSSSTGEILDEAEYDQWLQDVTDEMEDEDQEDPTEDLDHLIHRPDDDPADLLDHDDWMEALKIDAQYEESARETFEEYWAGDEVPACGGCSGCCECLGDPPLEYLAEKALERAQTRCNCGWADCTNCGE